MDKDAYKRMTEKVAPSEALIRKTKNKMIGEELIMKKRSFSMAAIAALVLMLCTTTAFAAWYFLKPSEVAEQLGDHALSAVFKGADAVNINQSVTSGAYTFTLLSVASGKDISDMLFHSDGELRNDRTYAVLAIQKADGTLIDRQSDEYLNTSFFVSPLIKGANPALVNIVSMNGSYSETVTDGIIYRIIACDNIEMFADRTLYLAACSGGPFYNWNAFTWNEQSGEIAANPNFTGASAVFDLPVGKNLADPVKAEQYLKDLLPEPAAGSDITNAQNGIDSKESESPVLLPQN